MIQVRNNIFETNSSSSHSIVATKESSFLKEINPGWKMDDNGVITFWESDLEFGRSPFDILSDWYDRLRYVIAAMENTHMDEITNACVAHIPGFTAFDFEGSFYETKHGYIDHQSFGLLQETLEKHKISIEDFIFNDKYIVIIDGDEYCVFDRLTETPMFDSSKIDYVEHIF